MTTIVNIGQRKFTIQSEQGPCDLAPSKEVKVKREQADLLIQSFPKEIKLKHEEHVKVEALMVEEVEPVKEAESKKAKHKK
jgi:hypothetical protein